MHLNDIKKYFKNHRGFAKIWDKIQKNKLANTSVIGLLVKIYEKRKNQSTIFLFENSSYKISIVLSAYDISLNDNLLYLSDGKNDLTLNLKNVIIEPIVGITTNFKNRNKLRIY